MIPNIMPTNKAKDTKNPSEEINTCLRNRFILIVIRNTNYKFAYQKSELTYKKLILYLKVETIAYKQGIRYHNYKVNSIEPTKIVDLI
jgi:hypothetical protein